MHKLYNVQDKLIKKIEEYDENGDITRSNAEEIKILSSAADHIGNICRNAEESDEYSNRAYPDGMGGSYRGGRGNSYRGGSYNGGSYARGRMNARRDSMGRYSGNGYSRDDGEDMIEKLREVMEDAPDQLRQDIQRLISKAEQM